MSDYTPDGMSESEPSMEDILASIRKIIADDSSKPEAPAPDAPELSVLSGGADARPVSEPLDSVLDLDDDAFSEFLTDDLSEAPSGSGATDSGILDLTDTLLSEHDPALDTLTTDDLTDFDGDFDLVLDDDDSEDTISLKAAAAVSAAGAAAVAATLPSLDPADFTVDDALTDIDTLVEADFDDLDFDSDIPIEAEQVFDPGADLISGDDDFEATSDDGGVGEASSAFSEDADIDLVKSLMAELTEDEDGYVDGLAQQDVADTSSAAADASDDDFDIDDLLPVNESDPSEMTGVAATADETAEDDLPIGDDLASIVAQSSADIETAKSDALALETGNGDDDVFDIATLIEDAEQSAAEVPSENEAENPGILGAAIAGASVLGVSAAALSASAMAKAADTSDDVAIEAIEEAAESAHDFDTALELDTPIPDGEIAAVEPEIEPEIEIAALAGDATLEKDTDMPRIVKSDTLATEETVEATSSAFASLNQVVEEKAVFNESGPRIGDLVQEALKPMLQDWLDKNLKGIVDRAVAKEIKRISSGK